MQAAIPGEADARRLVRPALTAAPERRAVVGEGDAGDRLARRTRAGDAQARVLRRRAVGLRRLVLGATRRRHRAEALVVADRPRAADRAAARAARRRRLAAVGGPRPGAIDPTVGAVTHARAARTRRRRDVVRRAGRAARAAVVGIRVGVHAPVQLDVPGAGGEARQAGVRADAAHARDLRARGSRRAGGGGRAHARGAAGSAVARPGCAVAVLAALAAGLSVVSSGRLDASIRGTVRRRAELREAGGAHVRGGRTERVLDELRRPCRTCTRSSRCRWSSRGTIPVLIFDVPYVVFVTPSHRRRGAGVPGRSRSALSCPRRRPRRVTLL